MPLINMFGRRAPFPNFLSSFFSTVSFSFAAWNNKIRIPSIPWAQENQMAKTVRSIFFFFRSGVLRGKLPQSTRSWNRITNVELVILLEAVRKSWLGPFQVPMNKPLVWFSFLHAEDDESDGEEEVPHEEETLRIWGKYKIYIKLRKSIHTFWAKPLISASSILSQSIGVHF